MRIVALLLLWSCARPQPNTPLAPIQVSVFSDEGIQEMVREVVPLVERHAEREFVAPPTVERFDAEAFKVYIGREAKLMMDAVQRDTPDAVRQRKAAALSKTEIRGLFGKYGIYDQKTYIVPEAIGKVSREGVRVVDLARLILAHELTHALQDQENPARRTISELLDLEHFHCWSAVSEGGANFIAWRVAQDLGLESAFWYLADAQGWGPDGLNDPDAYPLWMSYGRGREALEAVVRRDGMDGFWRWHAAPPVSTSMLFRPQTYAPTLVPGPFNDAEVLRTTEQQLTAGDWLVSNARLGEYELRGEAIQTGKEAAFDAILPHLLSAHHLELSMDDRRGDIRILHFDTSESAMSYLRLLRAEQTVDGQHLAKKSGQTVEVTYGEVKGVEGDASLLRTQALPAGGLRVESRTGWVVRGADVVAVTAARFRPGLRLARTINAVFERLQR